MNAVAFNSGGITDDVAKIALTIAWIIFLVMFVGVTNETISA